MPAGVNPTALPETIIMINMKMKKKVAFYKIWIYGVEVFDALPPLAKPLKHKTKQKCLNEKDRIYKFFTRCIIANRCQSSNTACTHSIHIQYKDYCFKNLRNSYGGSDEEAFDPLVNPNTIQYQIITLILINIK